MADFIDSDFDTLFADLIEEDSSLTPFLEYLQDQIPGAVFELHLDNGGVIPREKPLNPATAILTGFLAEARDKQTLICSAAAGPGRFYGLAVPEINAVILCTLPGFTGVPRPNSWEVKFLRSSIDLALLKMNRDAYGIEIEQYAKQVEVLKESHNEQLEDNYRNYELLLQRETDLLAANEQLKEVSRLKSQFLANMSHEIRTPLNGIIGMAEVALGNDPDQEQRTIFETIHKEAVSLLNIVNTVLDFSKLEAGKLEIEEIPFNLRVLVEDLAQSFAYRAEQKGLCLCAYLTPEINPHVIGDPSRLRQILVNLAGNALKFTDQGEVCIKGDIIADQGDRMRIRFLIKDTGIGIPSEKLAVIFDDFTQVDGSTTRLYGGTGLGTTIAKQLLELMGGEIGVESEEGKGSTFWFTLPLIKQQGKEAGQSQDTVDLAQAKVLVVDNSPAGRGMLAEYLRSWNCQPTEAAGQEEALAMLLEAGQTAKPYNLVLIDIHQPEINSLDLAERIKTTDGLAATPIIVFTSAGSRGDGKRCRELGIDGYLAKPIKLNDLRKSIELVLGLSRDAEEHKVAKPVTRHTIAEDSRSELQILLVEDYPTNQLVAMSHLQKAGYQVDLAENGLQAVDNFKRKQYNLVLMDIQMPVMDGYEATASIREHELKIHNLKLKADAPDNGTVTGLAEKTPIDRIPIIAMTAHAIKGYREKCLAAGMDDYTTKPLNRKEFLALVDKWGRIGSEFAKGENDPAPAEKDRSQTAVISQPRPTSPPEQPAADIMDFTRALAEFENDKDFLLEIINGFQDNVTKQLAIIAAAIKAGDSDTVMREAHSIKGGAANLTAENLRSVAFELENIGRAGELTQAPDTLARLATELARFTEFCRKID